MTLAIKMKVWVFSPRASLISGKTKAEIDSFAEKRVNILKKMLAKQKPSKTCNYVTDIYCKWIQKRFYLCAKYACPGKNALSPSFESKFARLERIGDGTFRLFAMRHTGEWMPILSSHKLRECFKELETNSWFTIF